MTLIIENLADAIQEDFGLLNARRLLDEYSPKFACFNDDVQGTGCVTLAGVMAACRVAKIPLKDIRVIVFGAGTAGTGIADQIRDAMAVDSGKDAKEAGKQIWCVDKSGLLLESKKDQLTPAQIPFARDESDWKGKEHGSLLGVVKEVKPHVLIGTSTRPGAFTEEVVKEMAKHVERPIIFPLSNPTRLHEAKPEDLVKWTDGKALVATGSPFPPVEYGGKKYEIGKRCHSDAERTVLTRVAECNNSVCFPGIGLGVVLSRTRLLPSSLIVAAVRAFADQAPALKDPSLGLLPDVTEVREVSVKIAKAVIRASMKEGLNEEKEIPTDDAELEEWVREQMWDAGYRPLRKVDEKDASDHALGVAGTARK